MHVQLSAGSVAVSICAQLGHWLELKSRDAFCIAAAAQFVLEATPTALAAAHASAARSSQPPAQHLEAWAEVAWHCANCTTALATVLTALPMSGEQHDVTAAFAGSTARPAVLLPWLQDVTQALLAVGEQSELWDQSGEHHSMFMAPQIVVCCVCVSAAPCPCVTPCLPLRCLHTAKAADNDERALLAFASCVSALTTDIVWHKHVAVIQADQALRQDVVAVLLGRCLPSLGAAAMASQSSTGSVCLMRIERGMQALVQVLISGCLKAAVLGHLQQEGSLAAAAVALSSILQALPARCPVDGEQRLFVMAWSATVQLASQLVAAVLSQTPAGGGSGAGGHIPACHNSEWHAVALAVLRSFPKIATALLTAASYPVDDQRCQYAAMVCHLKLAAWCTCLAQLLYELVTACEAAGGFIGDPALFVQASVAGMQLQPALALLRPRLLQAADLPPDLSAADSSADRLSGALFECATHTLMNMYYAPEGSPHSFSRSCSSTRAAGGDLKADMALLHSRLCCLIHFLAGGGALPGAFEHGHPICAQLLAMARLDFELQIEDYLGACKLVR